MTYTNITSNIGIGLIGFGYQLGADFEKPGSYGTSHLMEHLMCKPFDDMLPKMKRLGIDYNAYTLNDRLFFYFTGLNESLQDLGQILYDKVTNNEFIWSKEGFESEKNVVLQEYSDVFNNQICGVYENLTRKHFNYYGAIGLYQDIENFSYDDSIHAMKLFKNPSWLLEVGDNFLNKDKINFAPNVNLTKETKFDFYNSILETVPKESKTIVGLQSKQLIQDKIIANRFNFVLECLNSGLESPLSIEIRDKRGLSYGSNHATQTLYGNTSFVLYAQTDVKTEQELSNVYKEFFSNDVSRHLTCQRFDDCLQASKVLQKMYKLLPHTWAMHLMEHDNSFIGLENITYEDAIQLIHQYLNFSSFEQFQY